MIEKLTGYFLSIQDAQGFFPDEFNNLVDPRATAEVAKSLLFLNHKEPAMKAFLWLVKTQNKNGSWNAILVDGLKEESCLSAAIIGRLLLIAYKETKNKELLEAAKKAGTYVLSKEFEPGFFIKSGIHYADVLNVNASCAAFLQELYTSTKEKKYFDAKERAIFNIMRNQFKDGGFPYADHKRRYPYEYHYNVYDPHYHAITLFFLLKADPKGENYYFNIGKNKSIKWLKKVFNKGKVDWSYDFLLFSMGLMGIYCYAAYCFRQFHHKECHNVLAKLKKTQANNGVFKRYDGAFSVSLLIKAIFREMLEYGLSSPVNYSLKTKIIRIKKKIGIYLRNKKNSYSTYYTAQIFDCLTDMQKEFGIS